MIGFSIEIFLTGLKLAYTNFYRFFQIIKASNYFFRSYREEKSKK